MSLNKFTLDIEPSSPESTMDDATEDEASVNQIVFVFNSTDYDNRIWRCANEPDVGE